MVKRVGTTLQAAGRRPAAERLACLRALEQKVLWLAAWTIHNANHLRPSRDGLKVGGHQASCASLVTIMTALYFEILRPEDRVAVKPHASPVFHAIQYLLGNQELDKLERFRGFGGAQSYPSRTKDVDDVDFSTGSVGLGVAMTSFASLVQDYVRLKDWAPAELVPGRMVALVGDAELDEGNIYEALHESWKHDLRNTWWVIDYNRQSLDAVVTDRLFGQIDKLFDTMGWNVVSLKYGKRLQAAFERPGGGALRRWIDECPNSLYSALVFMGGAAWRRHLMADIGDASGVKELLDCHDDGALAALMTNLAGHDLESVLEAFHGVADDRPTCFLAYTIKGFGLPFAGHKDNHAGLMNPEQMATFMARNRIAEGAQWAPFEGLDLPAETLRRFLDQVPFAAAGRRRRRARRVEVPARLPVPAGDIQSSQEGFGRILGELARQDSALAERIVTASPDVAVSTNLGAWVNRRGIFDRHAQADVFKEQKVVSAQRWAMSPAGQHIELGIAENNLFLLLAALGLSHSLFGVRLLPIGTLYDPFIQRGLDALNYACYQDARFFAGGDPLRHHPGARRRRPPVDFDAANRPGAGRPGRLRAGLRRRAGGDHGLGLRLPAARRRVAAPRPIGCATSRAARSICACRPGRSPSQNAAWTTRWPTTSSPAATGWCRPDRAQSWPSSTAARWHRRRSRRTPRSPRTCPAPACSR